MNVTFPYALELADEGWEEAVRRNKTLAGGVNMVMGKLAHKVVADALGMAGKNAFDKNAFGDCG